jgi:HEAT repeat protein
MAVSPLISLDTLDTTTTLLILFAGCLVLVVIAFQIGVLASILAFIGILARGTIQTGFLLWKHLLSWAPWPIFLLLVIGLHIIAWHDGTEDAVRALVCGAALIFLGVITCLAYIFIDSERVEVQRGYKVLHNPVKGQGLASHLARHGQRVGIPLMVVATLATMSGFALFNQGLYDTSGREWYTLTPKKVPGSPVATSPAPVETHPPAYLDFLAYTLIHLSHIVDLLDIANSYNYARVTYVRQARWPASTLLVLFNSFFTLVLLQQIFAAIRRFKLLGETIQDYWSPHQPIHDRAGLALATFGTNAIEPLLRSLRTVDSLTASQRAEIATILADIGTMTVPVLVKHLHNPSETVRAVAVSALGRLHALEALPALSHTTQDASEMVRQSLVEALGTIASPGSKTLRKKWSIRLSLQVSRRWFGRVLRLKRWLLSVKELKPVELVTDVLRRLLSDPLAEVRMKAAQTLANFGAEAADAAPELIALLNDNEESVRRQAVEALGKIGGPPDTRLEALQPLLQDPSMAVRVVAVRTIGSLGVEAKQSVYGLVPLLRDPEPEVRQTVAEAIRQIGSVEPEAIPHLVEGLSDTDNLVRAQTAEALGMIGASAAAAVPALERALADVNDRVRATATEALGHMGGAAAAAVPAIMRLLNDEDNRINALAASALEEIGEPATIAVPALLGALNHVNAEVRGAATRAIGKLSTPTNGAVAALERAVSDENSHQRGQAILALVEIKAPAERIRVAVHKGLQDSDPQVRRAAIQALGKHGDGCAELVANLIEALGDSSDEVKTEAANVLPGLAGGTPEVVAGLAGLLQDDTPDVQISGALALGNLGKAALDAGAKLLRAFQTGETAVREQILQAFAKIQPPEAMPAFAAGLTDPDPAVRKMASAGLLEAGPVSEDVLPLLHEALKDPENRVKANAAQVLAGQATVPPESVPLLVECTANADDTVRLNAFRALRAASADELATVSERLLEDSNLNVRLEAAGVILAVNPKDEQAAAVVLEALTDAVPKLRQTALELVQSLGTEGTIVRELLVQQAGEEQKEAVVAILVGSGEKSEQPGESFDRRTAPGLGARPGVDLDQGTNGSHSPELLVTPRG